MSASSNYNAITNLTETIIDYLVVDTAEIDTALIENLDCNVGTIDTLTSTTATITSANIPTLTNTTLTNTTTNTTNLNTNNIQANPVSSAVTLYTTHTGTLTLGNTSNSNALTINNNINLPVNKSITLDITGAGLITAPSFRAINSVVSDTINAVASGNTISLYSNSTTAGITLGGGQTSGNIRLGNITPASDTGILNIHKNTTIASGKNLLCDTIQGTTAGSSINLFSNSTGSLTFGNTSNTNSLTMNNGLTMANDKVITINGEGYLIIPSAVGRTNAFIRVEKLNSWAIGNPISLWTSTTGLITLGNVSGTLTINSTASFINSMTMATDKNITLSGTGKITTPNILVSGLTASKLVLTDASDNLISSLYDETTLPVSTPQQTALDLKADKASPTFTGVITAPEIRCPLYNSTNATTLLEIGKTNTTASINIGQVQTSGNVSIGNSTPASDTGTLTINKNTTISSGKKITTPAILVSGLTASKIVLTDAFDNLISSSFTDSDFARFTASNTFSGALNTFTNTLACNTISATSTTSTGSLYANILAGGVNIATSLTGSMNLATSMRNGILTIGSASFNIGTDTGYVVIHMPLYVNQDINLDTGKNVILSSSGKVVCNTIESASTAGVVDLFGNHLFNLNIGNSSNSGDISFNQNVRLISAKNLFIGTSGILFCNVLEPNTGSALVIGAGMSTQSISIANNQTSGNISIGNSTPATDTGGLTINKITTFGAGKDLLFSSTGRIRVDRIVGSTPLTSDINLGYTDALYTADILLNQDTVVASNRTFSCNTIRGLTAAGNISLYSTTTGTLTLGNTGGGNLTINPNVVLASNKNLTLQGTGTILSSYYESVNATTSVRFGGSNTTSDIFIGGVLTSGTLVLSNLSATAPITLRNKVRIQTTIADAWFNVALGSANNIFQGIISASAMPPVYAAAPTDDWAVWESNTESEGSFIAQNGNTMIICNPGDNSAFHWQDEDTMGSASGFKFSTTGVMTTSSDRRLKRDINPIPVGSDLLDKLSLIQYVNYKKKAPTEEKYFRDGKLRKKYQEVHKGLIAQDIKDIFPEVVEREDNDSYFMMKYAEVDIYFNMGVQELIKRDKEKQAQIDDLTARLARLEILLNP